MMKRLFEREMARTKQTARKRTGPEPTKVWVEAEVGASAAPAPTPNAEEGPQAKVAKVETPQTPQEREFAKKMAAAAAVARNAVERKYNEAAVAAGETEWSTNLEAWNALEEKFKEYSKDKYHKLMWGFGHKLSAASVEMEARWAEEMEDAS